MCLTISKHRFTISKYQFSKAYTMFETCLTIIIRAVVNDIYIRVKLIAYV